MSTTSDSTAITATRNGCTPLEGALRIPVGLIEPSPLNPRKTWKAERVASMAEDLKAHSQIQPIRVRPNPRHTGSNGRPPYEIVVGETRWRAAPIAGLQTLDAIVSDCTDHQLIQLALSENTKRQDLNALEEADAFDALLRKPDGLQGYATVQELAAAVAVSPSHVYQRLKLRNLCTAGREAFLSGKIDAGVALLIARMPDQAEQARATAKIVAGFGGEAFSYRNAAEYLKREFMLRLDLARFDTGGTYSVAGPCAACPKRSGAAPDLFADLAGGGDMCQDARCYQAKTEEAHQALLQAARDAGRTVLQGNKAKALLRDRNATPVGHYRLDAACPALTDSARPLSALLGQGFAGQIVVVDLGDGAPIELVPEEVARKAIKARGLLRKPAAEKPAPVPSPAAKPAAPLFNPKPTTAPPPAGGPAQGGAGADEREEPIKLAAPRTGEAGAMPEKMAKAAEAAKVLHKLGQLLLTELDLRLAQVAELPLLILRLAVRELWRGLCAEECALLFAARGWKLDGPGVRFDDVFDRHVRLADGRELGTLLALLLVVPEFGPDSTNDLETVIKAPPGLLAEELGIDMADLRRMAKVAVRGAPAQPDATDVFVATHGRKTQPATRADEVSDEASAPRPEPVIDPDWKFPSGHI